jgi:hypothetical protein
MARGDLISADEVAARAAEAAEERRRALAAFGMRLEEEDEEVEAPGPPEFHLLTECVPVFTLWRDVQTQWRHSFVGPSGMDYASVEAYMRMSQNPLRRSAETIHLLRVMERATLAVAAEKRAMANAGFA